MLASLALTAAASPPPDPSEIARELRRLEHERDWIFKAEAINRLAAWKAREAEAPLRRMLHSQDDAWVRGRALVALGRIAGGNAVLDEALRAARDPSPALREAALETLAVLGSPGGRPVVARALDDPVPRVRYRAVSAIAELAGEEAWPILHPRLAQDDPAMQRHIARAVPAIATEDAVQALLPLLEDTNTDLRCAAIEALGKVQSTNALAPLLTAAAYDKNPGNRTAARAALAGYPPEVLRPYLLGTLDGDSTYRLRTALELLGPIADVNVYRASADALANPTDHQRESRSHLLTLLANSPDARYRDLFVRHLEDPANTVRRAAIPGVAASQPDNLFELLRPVMADDRTDVKIDLLKTLANARWAKPKGSIIEYLGDTFKVENWYALKPALQLVGRHATQAELESHFDTVGPVLELSHRSYRQAAARELAAVGNEELRMALAAAQGYLTDWRVIGPFPSDNENRGFTAVYPPEIDVDNETPCDAHYFGQGAIFAPSDGNGGRQGLLIGPPKRGSRPKTIVSFHVEIAPDARLQAVAALAPRSEETAPVKLSVLVGKQAVFATALTNEAARAELDVDLSAFAGTKASIEFVVEALDNPAHALLVLRRPRLATDGGKALRLATLWKQAAVRIDMATMLNRTVVWTPQRVGGEHGALLLHRIFPQPTHYLVAYAATTLESPVEQDIVLEVMGDDGIILWVNGRQMMSEPGHVTKTVTARLRAGENRILAKVANTWSEWKLAVRVTDEKGRARKL